MSKPLRDIVPIEESKLKRALASIAVGAALGTTPAGVAAHKTPAHHSVPAPSHDHDDIYHSNPRSPTGPELRNLNKEHHPLAPKIRKSPKKQRKIMTTNVNEAVKRDPGRAKELADELLKRSKSTFSKPVAPGYISTKYHEPPATVRSAIAHHYAEADANRPGPFKTTHEKLPTKHLLPIQASISRKRLDYQIDRDEHAPVKVMRHQGQNWLFDGHHRHMARRLAGHEFTDATVYHVPERTNNKPPKKRSLLGKLLGK